MDLSPEIEQFARACEYLLSRVDPPALSDEERAMVEYYTRELFLKYGLSEY